MLTNEKFMKIPAGAAIAEGELPNSPEGLYMTDFNEGAMLKWVAQKGRADDWCIYCHWDGHPSSWVRLYGDKVMLETHIRRCVPCDEKVFMKYRY